MALAYTRPRLYAKQERAFFNPKRYSLIEASTKAGKTVAAIAWIIEKALAGQPGQNFWWVAPVSDQAKIAFTRIKNGLTAGTFTTREAPTPLINFINGTILWFKSGDNPDSLYGEDVFAGVVDEASRCKEESWHALRSTLTATQGPVRIIGNVKGRKNWFYRLARLAESGVRTRSMHYERITVLDAIAAGVISQEEVEDARAIYPEHVFRELYMAEPSDDGGNPFGLQHITACAARYRPSVKRPVAFGIDLAKRQDYFVVIGLDEDGMVVAFDRWQGLSWPSSIERVYALVGDDTPALVDSTGVGDPVLDTFQQEHGNFRGYQFTNVSKQKLMEGLAVSIQRHEIGLPPHSVGPIIEELENFEYITTPSGRVAYSAPEGLHDDCVAALALARQQFAEAAPAASLIEYYSREAHEAAARAAKAPGVLIDNIDDLDDNLAAPFAGRQSLISNEERLDNELTKLYEDTLAGFVEGPLLCYRCHGAVGPDRVTDGHYVWHRACITGGVPQLRAA